MRENQIHHGGLLRIFGLCAGILLGATGGTTFASQSQSVELNWNPSASPDVVGYNIYYGEASGDYTNEISVGTLTNLTVSGLANGVTYYFAARAVNSSGIESPYSIQAFFAAPSTAAIIAQPLLSGKGVSITVKGLPGTLYVIQASTDLVNWVSLETNLTPLIFTDTNTQRYNKRFYRAVYLF